MIIMALYQLEDIRMVHLELSSRCNASCPMCGRNQSGGAVHSHLPLSELTLAQVQKIFPEGFIRQLQKVYFCGNFGDPIMAQECVEIAEYFRRAHPELNISLHTNGGARDVGFWQRLAKVLTTCRFGVDGLEDTNHLYRQGVSWKILDRNVSAFVSAGGRAEWDFLIFKHNEHQIQAAQKQADEWGIKKINFKSTARFFSSRLAAAVESVPVHNKSGEVTHHLVKTTLPDYENPYYRNQKNLLNHYSNLQEYWDQTPIRCRVAEEKNIYVSAQGYVLPCCWIGNEIFPAPHLKKENQVLKLLESAPEKLESLNALERGLQEVLRSDFFVSQVSGSWNKPSLQDGKLRVCARTCGVELKPFEGQFL